jgi:hypothetical protein
LLRLLRLLWLLWLLLQLVVRRLLLQLLLRLLPQCTWPDLQCQLGSCVCCRQGQHMQAALA